MASQANSPGFFYGHWQKRARGAPRNTSLSLILGAHIREQATGGRRHIWLGDRLGAAGETDPESFHEATGIYAHILIDDDRDEVILGTDRFGVAPVYYFENDGGLHFSTSLTVLKNRMPDPKPDLDSWRLLHRLSDIPGNRTVLRDVYRLGYGERLRLRGDSVLRETVWSPHELDLKFESGDGFLQRNNELLEDALGLLRTADRPLVVTLSGGDDSRRVALAASRAGLDFRCVSQEAPGGDWWDEDTAVARMISERLGAPFEKIPCPDSERCVENDRFGRDLFDWETFQHGWAIETFRGVSQPSIAIDGVGFDIAVNGHFYHRMPEYRTSWRDIDRVAEMILGDRPMVPLREDGRDMAFGTIRKELSRLPPTAHALSLYYLLNHARRATGAWHQAMRYFGHAPAAPFFHMPLFEQSLYSDPEEAGKEYLQTRAIRFLDPEIGAMPSTRGSVPREWKTDLRQTVNETIRKKIRRTRIRPEVYDMYDANRARLAIDSVRSTILSVHNSWRIMPMICFSEFLNWLERRDDPWIEAKTA